MGRSTKGPTPQGWKELDLAQTFQSGLLTRGQCLAAGMTYETVRHRLRTRRWVGVAPGVYLTTPGRTGWDVDVSAALLAAAGFGPTELENADGDVPIPPVALWGPSSARAHEFQGAERAARGPIILAVPASSDVRPPRGVTVRRLPDFERRVEPVSFPWRMTKASTIVDCASLGAPDDALAWLARGVQQRIPTADLEAELRARRRVRHGALLREALGDVAGGAHSAAEYRYVRDVERAHGLPVALRQVNGKGVKAVHDNVYEDFDVVIEVDGRLGHEEWADRIKDGRRDRQAGGTGRWTSRVFWPDVAVTQCATAVDVGRLLRARGWSGSPSVCRRAGCRAELARFAA